MKRGRVQQYTYWPSIPMCRASTPIGQWRRTNSEQPHTENSVQRLGPELPRHVTLKKKLAHPLLRAMGSWKAAERQTLWYLQFQRKLGIPVYYCVPRFNLGAPGCYAAKAILSDRKEWAWRGREREEINKQLTTFLLKMSLLQNKIPKPH